MKTEHVYLAFSTESPTVKAPAKLEEPHKLYFLLTSKDSVIGAELFGSVR